MFNWHSGAVCLPATQESREGYSLVEGLPTDLVESGTVGHLQEGPSEGA